MADDMDMDLEPPITMTDILIQYITTIQKHDHTLMALNTAVSRLSTYIYNPPAEASTDVAKAFRPLLPKISTLDHSLKTWSAQMQLISSFHQRLLTPEPPSALAVLSAINDAFAHLMTTVIKAAQVLDRAIQSLGSSNTKNGVKATKMRGLRNELKYLHWEEEVEAFHSRWETCWVGLGGSLWDGKV